MLKAEEFSLKLIVNSAFGNCWKVKIKIGERATYKLSERSLNDASGASFITETSSVLSATNTLRLRERLEAIRLPLGWPESMTTIFDQCSYDLTISSHSCTIKASWYYKSGLKELDELCELISEVCC